MQIPPSWSAPPSGSRALCRSDPNLPLSRGGNPLFINKIKRGKWDGGGLVLSITVRLQSWNRGMDRLGPASHCALIFYGRFKRGNLKGSLGVSWLCLAEEKKTYICNSYLASERFSQIWREHFFNFSYFFEWTGRGSLKMRPNKK